MSLIGHNLPPAEAVMRITEDLDSNYADVAGTVERLLSEAHELPPVVDDDATLGLYAKMIKAFRDTAARLKALHDAEKTPYLRAGQAVDQWFFSKWDKCVRRSSGAKPGAADVLQRRMDEYNQRKLREEQERRRAEAELAARIAREEQAKAERVRREAEEARLAAERARKPEHIAAKEVTASAAEELASAATTTAVLAAEEAREAHVQTLAKPADLVRHRVDEGPLVTMATEGYAEIEDETKLDKEALWPFIPLKSKEQALRAWAKTNGHSKPMQGASIGKRQKSVVR